MLEQRRSSSELLDRILLSARWEHLAQTLRAERQARDPGTALAGRAGVSAAGLTSFLSPAAPRPRPHPLQYHRATPGQPLGPLVPAWDLQVVFGAEDRIVDGCDAGGDVRALDCDGGADRPRLG